jgi:hypothetical protein
MKMRSAFEAWAQRDGHIVRRREDKPDEYLVFETQRRWAIWQAALAHGQAAAASPRPALQKAVPADPVGDAAPSRLQQTPVADDAALRNRVLNEVLDAFSDLDNTAGIDGMLKVIQALKKKQRTTA